jgi:hypothetical protein
MLAANDIAPLLLIVGEPVKRVHDYTLVELHQVVMQATGGLMSERSFRRIADGLKITKGDNGFYSPPDAILIIGWIKNRDKYFSYNDYRQREGKTLYKKAQEANFYASEL